MEKSELVLVGYAKTKLLLPGDKDEVEIDFSPFDILFYGKNYVLEKESMRFILNDSSGMKRSIHFVSEKSVEKCLDISSKTRKERILENLPKEIAQTGDKGIKLNDVKNGKNKVEEFVDTLRFFPAELPLHVRLTMIS